MNQDLLQLDYKTLVLVVLLIIGCVIVVPFISRLKTKIGTKNVAAFINLLGVSTESVKQLVTKIIESIDSSKLRDNVYVASIIMNQIYVIINKLNGDTLIDAEHYNLEAERLLSDLSQIPSDVSELEYKQKLISIITTHLTNLLF